jgi:hypothetical protein
VGIECLGADVDEEDGGDFEGEHGLDAAEWHFGDIFLLFFFVLRGQGVRVVPGAVGRGGGCG